MNAIDYNNVLNDQFCDIERSRQKLGFLHSFLGKCVSPFISIDSFYTKINKLAAAQLFQSKGVLSEIKANDNLIQDKDLNKLIKATNNLLSVNISFHSVIIEVIDEMDESSVKPLLISKEIIEETINTLYSILNIIKKANLKYPKETSDIAINSSRKSVDTLSKVIFTRNGQPT